LQRILSPCGLLSISDIRGTYLPTSSPEATQQHDYFQEQETSYPKALRLHSKVQYLYYFVVKAIALVILVHYTPTVSPLLSLPSRNLWLQNAPVSLTHNPDIPRTLPHPLLSPGSADSTTGSVTAQVAAASTVKVQKLL